MEMVTHIRKDWPELVSIMNKVIAAMKQEELPRIMNKWFLEWPKQAARVSRVNLTPEERVWLAQQHPIRVTFSLSPPYFYFKEGKAVGIALDFLNLISSNTVFEFQLAYKPHRWADEFKG